MSLAVQHRRGTTANHAGFTGLSGEITVDTSKTTAVVHDGATAGGHPLALESALASYQPLDADLTALAASAATAGLVERTGAAAYTTRLLGVGASTSVPTKGDLATVAISGSASDLGSGTLAAARMPALTGDVTTSAGAVATTIGANKVLDTMLRDSAALSVIGRSANSSGDPADITAGADGDVLRRSGTAVTFGTIPEASVTNLVSDLANLRPRAEPAPNSHTFALTFSLAAGDTLVIPRYAKVNDGVVLTIGDDADLVIL